MQKEENGGGEGRFEAIAEISRTDLTVGGVRVCMCVCARERTCFHISGHNLCSLSLLLEAFISDTCFSPFDFRVLHFYFSKTLELKQPLLWLRDVKISLLGNCNSKCTFSEFLGQIRCGRACTCQRTHVLS